MWIFILLILIVFLLFVLLYQIPLKSKEKIYCIIIAVFLCAVAAFRSAEVGINDTKMVYLPQFEKIQNYKLSYILLNYKDPIFYGLSKLFTLFSTNERLWLTLISVPLIFAVTKLIYNESKNYLLSFIMFMSLGFYTLCSFTVLRHSIALAITILAYFQIKNKNFKRFLMYVILASCFHQTAIVFVFAYWICNLKILDKKYLFIIGAFILSITTRGIFDKLILYISTKGRYTYFYTNQTGLTYTYFFMSLLIIIFVDIFSSKEYKLTQEYEMMSRLILVGCCMTAFMPILGEFNRLSMFYLIYEIILLPNGILSLKNNKNCSLLILGSFFVFSLYLLSFGLENSGLLNYKFFWS